MKDSCRSRFGNCTNNSSGSLGSSSKGCLKLPTPSLPFPYILTPSPHDAPPSALLLPSPPGMVP